MLEEMGTSVFSGACTTLGASSFMFFATLQFFMQFGVFMFCTIGFSLLFSLGLFDDAPRVVHAPENTEVPISSNMSRVLLNLSLCSDK
jgi:hypothetical protein